MIKVNLILMVFIYSVVSCFPGLAANNYFQPAGAINTVSFEYSRNNPNQANRALNPDKGLKPKISPLGKLIPTLDTDKKLSEAFERSYVWWVTGRPPEIKSDESPEIFERSFIDWLSNTRPEIKKLFDPVIDLVGFSLREDAKNNIQDISRYNIATVREGQIVYANAHQRDSGGVIVVEGELVIDNYDKQKAYTNADINEDIKNAMHDPWYRVKKLFSADEQVFDVEHDRLHKNMSQKAALSKMFNGSYYKKGIVISEQGVVKLTFGTYQKIAAKVNGYGVLHLTNNYPVLNSMVDILGDIGDADHKLEKMIVDGGTSAGVGGSINVKKLYLRGGEIKNSTTTDDVYLKYAIDSNSPTNQFVTTLLSAPYNKWFQSPYNAGIAVSTIGLSIYEKSLTKGLEVMYPYSTYLNPVFSKLQGIHLALDLFEAGYLLIYSAKDRDGDYFYQHTKSTTIHNIEEVVFDNNHNTFDIFRQKSSQKNTENGDSITYLTNEAFHSLPKITINTNRPSTLYWLAHTDGVAQCEKFNIKLNADATIVLKPEIFVEHYYILKPEQSLKAYSTLPYYGEKNQKHTPTLEFVQPNIYQRNILSAVGVGLNLTRLMADMAINYYFMQSGPFGLIPALAYQGLKILGLNSLTSIHSFSDLVKARLGQDEMYRVKYFEFKAIEDVYANIVFNPNDKSSGMSSRGELEKYQSDRGHHHLNQYSKAANDSLSSIHFPLNYNYKEYTQALDSANNASISITLDHYQTVKREGGVWKINGDQVYARDNFGRIEFYTTDSRVLGVKTDPRVQVVGFASKASNVMAPLLRELVVSQYYNNQSQGYNEFDEFYHKALLGNILDRLNNYNYNGKRFDCNQMMIFDNSNLYGTAHTKGNNFGYLKFEKANKPSAIIKDIGNRTMNLAGIIFKNSAIIANDVNIFAPVMIGPELKMDASGVLDTIQKSPQPLDIFLNIKDGVHISALYNFNDNFKEISVGKNLTVGILASCAPMTIEQNVKIENYAYKINFKGDVEFLDGPQLLTDAIDESLKYLDQYVIPQEEYDKMISNLIHTTKDSQTWVQNIASNHPDMLSIDRVRYSANENAKKGTKGVDVKEFARKIMLHAAEVEHHMSKVKLDNFDKDVKSGYQNQAPYHKIEIKKALTQKGSGNHYTIQDGLEELENHRIQSNLRYSKDINKDISYTKNKSITIHRDSSFKQNTFDQNVFLCADKVNFVEFYDSKGSIQIGYGPLSPEAFLNQKKIYITSYQDQLLSQSEPDKNHMKQVSILDSIAYTKLSEPQEYKNYKPGIIEGETKILVVQTDTAGIEQVVGLYRVDQESEILKSIKEIPGILLDKRSLETTWEAGWIGGKIHKADVYKIDGKLSIAQWSFMEDEFAQYFQTNQASPEDVNKLKICILKEGVSQALRRLSDKNRDQRVLNQPMLYDHTAALNGSGNVIAAGEIGDVRINAYVDPFLQFEYDFDESRIAKKIAGASMGLFANVDKQSMLGIAYDVLQIEQDARPANSHKMALFGFTTLNKIYFNADISRSLGFYDAYDALKPDLPIAKRNKVDWHFLGKVGYHIDLNKNSKLMPYVALQHSTTLSLSGGIRFDGSFLVEDGDTLIKPFISYQITGSFNENQTNASSNLSTLGQSNIKLQQKALEVLNAIDLEVDTNRLLHQLHFGFDTEERNGMISAARITAYGNSKMVGVRFECRIGYKF